MEILISLLIQIRIPILIWNNDINTNTKTGVHPLTLTLTLIRISSRPTKLTQKPHALPINRWYYWDWESYACRWKRIDTDTNKNSKMDDCPNNIIILKRLSIRTHRRPPKVEQKLNVNIKFNTPSSRTIRYSNTKTEEQTIHIKIELLSFIVSLIKRNTFIDVNVYINIMIFDR